MKKNNVLAYSEFILVYCFYAFLNILPTELSLKIGRMLGIIFYKIDKKHRKHTLNNLRIAFPSKKDKELNDISIKFYKNLGMIFVEIFRLGKYNTGNIDDFVESNFEEIKNLYGKQGILLLTAHFGNWELLAKTFGLKGYKGNVLARPLDNPYIEKILYKLRTGGGNKVIYNRENAVKNIISALNENEIVGFLPDENASKRIGVFVDFFGVKACTMPGMANIAAKMKLPVIPAFIVRINDETESNSAGGIENDRKRGGYARHKLIIEPPLDIKYTGDRKTDTTNILKKFNEKIEDIIKQYPEQWFWIHNRWKTRPDNE
ncbi:MAG: lysophospholipid acyltransferase family protein [bacterium]